MAFSSSTLARAGKLHLCSAAESFLLLFFSRYLFGEIPTQNAINPAAVTKTPYNVQSYCLPDSSIITLIATCVTLKNGNHLDCNTRRQLLENDDYLFYNHVCFGRECGAGIICGSVACQAKRSATVW